VNAQKPKTESKKQFYPRVINKTEIDFSEDEINLLIKGLKYNLGHKQKNWVNNLAFEAESAISFLPPGEQEHSRYQVAQNIKKLQGQQQSNKTQTPIKIKEENKLINQIKQKLRTNEAITTKADKGNTVVIIYQKDYNQKIQDFISENMATEVKNNITTKFQRDLRNLINKCKNVIDAGDKWKLVNLNPNTASLRGLVKVHKKDIPIRPIVNFKDTPTYKTGRMLAKKLKTYIPLPYVYNVQNTVQLMKDLSEIPFIPSLKLTSYDISNMYTNIPKDELVNIIDKMCNEQNIEHTLKMEIINIVKLVIAQNYYKFGGKTYLQKRGLAVGAPTSSILSEIYMQHLENTIIYDILREFKIEGYFRYVDDILILYKETTTNIEEVLNSFNNINPKLRFSMEQEKDNKLNFLDITITKDINKLTYEVYRKPTTSDTMRFVQKKTELLL
jgi:hypothetical protein